jgi:hypothetical protein
VTFEKALQEFQHGPSTIVYRLWHDLKESSGWQDLDKIAVTRLW